MNTESDPVGDNHLSISLEDLLRELVGADKRFGEGSWTVAQQLLSQFSGVPWFIRRLATVGIGPDKRVYEVSQGFFFGFKKIVAAASADPLLSLGTPIGESAKKVDITALCASIIIHSLNKKIQGEAITPFLRQLVDDAVYSAQIGLILGTELPDVGPGRGMVAGYFLRIGVPLLLRLGSQDQANALHDAFCRGEAPLEAAQEIYHCSPLQCSALVLGNLGCSIHAARGMIDFYQNDTEGSKESSVRDLWGKTFYLTYRMTRDRHHVLGETVWSFFNLKERTEQIEVVDAIDDFARNPTDCEWLLQ
jgi:hypothetical protein